jgi:hypothetical protein
MDRSKRSGDADVMKKSVLFVLAALSGNAAAAIVALSTLPGASGVEVRDSFYWVDPRPATGAVMVSSTSYFGGFGYELSAPFAPLGAGQSVSPGGNFFNPSPQQQFIAQQSVWYQCIPFPSPVPDAPPVCPGTGSYGSIAGGDYGLRVTLPDGVHYGWVSVTPTLGPAFNQPSTFQVFVESSPGVAAAYVPEPSAALTLTGSLCLLMRRRRSVS